jgi:spermidine/putrescine transport system permease protein
MIDMVRSFGKGLTAVFFAAVLGWALMLIILPQIAMLEKALTKPARQLDSSIVGSLERDAANCVNILGQYAAPDAPLPDNGGMAVPSMSGMAVPSTSGMAVPSMSGMAAPTPNADAARPYILQCDRATTQRRLVRDDGEEVYLDQFYDLPPLSVAADAPIPDQIIAAGQIEQLAAELYQRLLIEEANSARLGLDNFTAISKPVLVPRSDAAQAQSDASLNGKMMNLLGLRFSEGADSYQRIGLEVLVRTLFFAVCATMLALVVCYPVAYKVALATSPEKTVWLMLGLIIPYAIVELMRIYAWTAIIDNRGLINETLMWTGAITEPIQFKRSALTVFVVIVYTYVLFMVFPIYNVMSTLDRNQIEAARDLGASSPRLHGRIIIPHSKAGIAVGCIATFMLAAGAFSVPRIISRGLQSEWFSQTIYNKFFEVNNSNVGAAYSFSYTFICFVIVGVFMWIMRTRLKDFARVQ